MGRGHSGGAHRDPLILIWTAEPRSAWRRWQVAVAVPLEFACLLAIGVFVKTSAGEQQTWQLRFKLRAKSLSPALMRSLNGYWKCAMLLSVASPPPNSGGGARWPRGAAGLPHCADRLHYHGYFAAGAGRCLDRSAIAAGISRSRDHRHLRGRSDGHLDSLPLAQRFGDQRTLWKPSRESGYARSPRPSNL